MHLLKKLFNVALINRGNEKNCHTVIRIIFKQKILQNTVISLHDNRHYIIIYFNFYRLTNNGQKK